MLLVLLRPCRVGHRGRLRLGDSLINDLADLPAGGVVARPESAIRVAGNRPTVIGGFYERVEGVVRRDVAEVGAAGRVYGPGLGQHHYFGELPPRDVAAPPE